MFKDWSVLTLSQWQAYCRSVAERANLRVTFERDACPSTDGKQITLPTPTLKMTREEGMDLLSAAVHETSHVQHSDFDAMVAGFGENDPIGQGFFNIIEDDRIEAICAAEWAGDKVAFECSAPKRVSGFIQSSVKAMQAHPEHANLIAKDLAVGIWGAQQRAQWAVEYDPTAADLATVPSNVMDMVAKLDASDAKRQLDAARYTSDLSGSRELIETAKYIKTVLGVTEEDNKQAKKAQQGKGQEGDGNSDPQYGKGLAKGAGADSGNHKEQEKAAKQGKEGHAEKSLDGKMSGVGLSNEKIAREAQGANKDWQDWATGPYTPVDPNYWTHFDAQERFGKCDMPKGYEQPASLRALAGKVRRLIQIHTQTLRQPAQKSGKLQGSALHRATLGIPGYSERVFVRKECELELDHAFAVLVDASGSMGGQYAPKMKAAIMAGSSLADVASNVLHIPTMVGMFSTSGGPENATVRAFEDKRMTRETLCGLMAATACSMGSSNIDAESVVWIGTQLLRQRAKRKVLIVLSDGLPTPSNPGNYEEYYRAVIADLEKRGVSVWGIGIQNQAVARYFTKYRVLTNADQIGTVLLELAQLEVFARKGR